MTPDSSTDPSRGGFLPTRWTLVLAARGDTPEARAALSDLCAAYYEPVLRFLRREGRTDDAARELAQEFFARVLSRSGFAGADPDRGRFRSYLLGALRHFLADRKDSDRTLRRGGGILPESLDAEADDAPALQVAAPGADPALEFDRAWALALMRRSLDRIREEYTAAGRPGQFAVLQPWLGGDSPPGPQAAAAEQLGLSGGALKVAIHRLRRRFREILRAEVADTVPNPADVDAELRHLVEVLARHPEPGR